MLKRCIKLGGSLLRRPEALPALLDVIVQFGPDSLLINGSGPFLYQANTLLTAAGTRPTGVYASQLLAATRNMTAAVIGACHPGVRVVNSLSMAQEARQDQYVPLMESLSRFGRGNGQCCGTGVHACQLCIEAGIKHLVLLTDVDGVEAPNGQLLSSLTPGELQAMGRTCVDIGIPELLVQGGIKCVVLNGFRHNVIQHYLMCEEVSIGTRIF